MTTDASQRISMHSGRVVKKSGANGNEPKPIYHWVEVQIDRTESDRFDNCKHLPHQNERECARRVRQKESA